MKQVAVLSSLLVLAFTAGCSSEGAQRSIATAITDSAASTNSPSDVSSQVSIDTKSDAKTLYSQLTYNTTYKEAVSILGSPTNALDLQPHYWPAENMSFWFDQEWRAHVFAPAYSTHDENGEARDSESEFNNFDKAREEELIAKYIDSQANIETLVQDFGEPISGTAYHYAYWDFSNGDRISLLFDGVVAEANGSVNLENTDIKMLVLEESGAIGDDSDWAFVVYYLRDYEGLMAVFPRMLQKQN
ncbi:MAG: hypothetical protein AAFY72_16175 [Cyanobacteria bacterium J06649_4]